MSKNNFLKDPISLAKVGNFTKHAVESFEEGIVTENNYLEKVDSNLKNKNKQ